MERSEMITKFMAALQLLDEVGMDEYDYAEGKMTIYVNNDMLAEVLDNFRPVAQR